MVYGLQRFKVESEFRAAGPQTVRSGQPGLLSQQRILEDKLSHCSRCTRIDVAGSYSGVERTTPI